MIKEEIIVMLNTKRGRKLQIGLAPILKEFSADKQVIEILCETAIKTDEQKVREAIIQALKSSSVRDEANERFIVSAHHSTEPFCRKWALTNLNALNCKTAKSTVLRGLQDPDLSVRVAAALNARHYYDYEEINALKRFFKINKFTLFWDWMINAARLAKRKLFRRIEDDLRNSRNSEAPFLW